MGVDELITSGWASTCRLKFSGQFLRIRKRSRRDHQVAEEVVWMQSCWFCFLLERSSSSGDSHGWLPGLGVRPASRAGLGSSMGIRSWRVSGALRPGGQVGQESQGGKAQWSLPRWGWQRPGAGRGPGLWQCRTVRTQARLRQPRGPAGSVRTHGGASPSPCAGRRSRSSGPRCNRCMSRWPCAHNSSSSGGEGG